jgi:Fe-S cluster assembly ATP-binding protein
MHLLEVKNLHVEVDGKQILNGLELSVSKGTVHAIMGPNGSASRRSPTCSLARTTMW